MKPFSASSKSRRYPRSPVLFAYAELGRNDGGVILNIGQGGLCVQTTAEIASDSPLPVRFQSLQSGGWVEATGRVVWRNETKTALGIEFIDPSKEARQEIQRWLGFGESLQELRGNWCSSAQTAKDDSVLPSEPGAPATEPPVLIEAELFDSPRLLTDDPNDPVTVRADSDANGFGIFRGRSADSATRSWNSHIAAFALMLLAIASFVLWTTRRAGLVRRAESFFSKKSPASNRSVSPSGKELPSSQASAATEPVSSALPEPPAATAATAGPAAENSSPSSSTSPSRLSPSHLAPSLPPHPPGADFVLQVAAMSSEENANALVQSLWQKKLPAFVSQRNSDHLFRVFVGPYADEGLLGPANSVLTQSGLPAIKRRWPPGTRGSASAR